MKKLVLFSAACIMSSSVIAGQCIIPKNCNVQSSEFSTGGGDKAIMIMEVDCKKPDGSIKKLIHQKASISGAFGFGRFILPKSIDFVKSKNPNHTTLDCRY